MRLGRVPLRRIASLDDVEAFVATCNPGVVLILDVDNTLVAQGAPPDEFRAAVNDSIDRFDQLAAVERVIALTNGPERGVPRMISRGNKPWTTRRRLGLHGVPTPVAVVGDQLLTDGVLAWRLGATHLQLVIDDEHEPRRQATMRRAGKLLERVMFKLDDEPRRSGHAS